MGVIRIVSRRGERFRSRAEAGQLLGEELRGLDGEGVVVLGIPRGGLVIAREVASALAARLDIVLSRKMQAPGYPELALGSVGEDGRMFLNHNVVRETGADNAYIEQERERQLAEIRRRSKLIRGILSKEPLQGKVAIVTDDGAATGATFQAALWAVRQEKPGKLIGALPVAPEDTVYTLGRDADELVCLRAPDFFVAVGQFYERFEQVDDYEVMEILREESRRR